MSNTDNWLSHDHSMYEELLSQAQDAVDVEDWEAAANVFAELVWHLKSHMAMEEEVLYPAFDRQVNISDNPTEALIEEHDSIVRTLTDLSALLKSKDPDHILDCLARLQELMLKHHEKEEDIFLPMASLLMQGLEQELSQMLKNFNPSHTKRKWDI